MPRPEPSRSFAPRPHPKARTALALALVAVLVLLPVACGGGDDEPSPAATNPPNTGATCDDPVGDLSRVASELGGTLKEPAGVDLIHAEARLSDTALRVSFTSAGPIAGTPDPEFRLGQGPAGQLASFELVAAPAEGDDWALRLVTFRDDGRGGIQEAPRTVLPVAVTVEGPTLSYEVPRTLLPAIATYVWLFGASSTSPDGTDTVIDDCEDYGGGSTTSAAPTTTAPGAGGAASGVGRVGDTLAYGNGAASVTVHAVELGPGDPGFQRVAVDLRVCAPAERGFEARREHVGVSAADDRSYPPGPVEGDRDPAFPAVVALTAGVCRRGWVTVPVPDPAPAVAVSYSPDPTGAGALRWTVG